MQIGNARIRLNKVGSDVPKTDITPAEALVLHVLHQGNNGGSTFGDDMDKIEVKGEAKSQADPTKSRTDREELRRLLAKYTSQNKKGDKIVKLIWPGSDEKLPQKFSDLKWNEINYDGTEVQPLNYATGAVLVDATAVAAKK